MDTSKRKEGEFLRLNEKWSVGVIANPPQWTLCQRKMNRGKETWYPVSFCQRRATLERAIREKVIFGADYYRGSENLAVRGDLMGQIANFPARCDG